MSRNSETKNESLKQEVLIQEIIKAYDKVSDLNQRYYSLGYDKSELIINLSNYLYEPNKILFYRYLSQIENFLNKSKLSQNELQKLGYALEELSLVVFHGLSNLVSIKSYQSPGAQIDLLISSDTKEWKNFIKNLPLKLSDSQTSIVIEAKATKQKVSDAQFSRLCNILDINFTNTSGLGIFFTINGASGFPTRNSKRKKKLSDSWLRQLLYYSRSNKAIIVFDINDIRQLDQKGSLIRIILNKIKEIEEMTGLPAFENNYIDIDTPQRFDKILQELRS